MTDQPAERLRVELRHEVGRVIVGVHGDVDALTAPQLTSALDQVVAHGGATIVLDVGSMSSMDGAGLAAVATMSAQLAHRGVSMTLRSGQQLAARAIGSRSAPGLRGADREALAGLAATGSQVSVQVIDGALRLVATLANAMLEKAFGVSVTLERDGRPTTVATTNDVVLRMDEHQYETGEGPCLSAKADGRQYYIESLDDEQRWPAFVPLALENGFRSILSSPLLAADRALGSLNIYSDTTHAFDDHDQTLAALFSEQASDVLTRAHADVADDEQKRRWTDGLLARQTIALAQGVLMHRDQITAVDAAASLNQVARTEHRTVLQHATEVLAPYAGDDPGRAGP